VSICRREPDSLTLDVDGAVVVPNAIVTGTLAPAAAAAAAWGTRLCWRCLVTHQHDCAGGGWSPLEVVDLLNVLIASRQVTGFC
jgi:hypothetical protein